MEDGTLPGLGNVNNLIFWKIFDAAMSRLKSLARHFEKDKDLLLKYNKGNQSQAKQGVIEKVRKKL